MTDIIERVKTFFKGDNYKEKINDFISDKKTDENYHQVFLSDKNKADIAKRINFNSKFDVLALVSKPMLIPSKHAIELMFRNSNTDNLQEFLNNGRGSYIVTRGYIEPEILEVGLVFSIVTKRRYYEMRRILIRGKWDISSASLKQFCRKHSDKFPELLYSAFLNYIIEISDVDERYRLYINNSLPMQYRSKN